jgi:hypothetical protein
MKTVAAFLLAVLGGNNSPSAEDIKKILASGMCSLLFIFFIFGLKDEIFVFLFFFKEEILKGK